MSNLVINEQDLQFILSRIGYPFVTEDLLEINFEQVKDVCILPALHDYFKWFPIKSQVTYSASGTYSIDFPDDFTYSAIDVRINTGRNGQSATTNPLINSTFIRQTSSRGSGMYGTRYDYGFDRSYYIERLEGQSSIDMYKSTKFNVNYTDRVVEGFTNVSGTLQVTWAKYSNDFNNVPFQRKREVSDLASAYLLRFFGELRLQGEMVDLPIAFDGQAFIDRAEELETKVIESWENFTKAVVIRK